MDQQGIVIESKGPDGWTIIGTGFLFGTALVIIALAIFNISVYLGWAAIVVAGGSSVTCVCFGAARIIEARGSAVAMVTEAKGRAKAQEIGAATQHIAIVRGRLAASEDRHVDRR